FEVAKQEASVKHFDTAETWFLSAVRACRRMQKPELCRAGATLPATFCENAQYAQTEKMCLSLLEATGVKETASRLRLDVLTRAADCLGQCARHEDELNRNASSLFDLAEKLYLEGISLAQQPLSRCSQFAQADTKYRLARHYAIENGVTEALRYWQA